MKIGEVFKEICERFRSDELRHILHAKILRWTAHRLADQLKRQFEEGE